jgi:reactive intermediate/imine deaminase
MTHQIITTNKAPKAIGTYSQAVRAGDTVYVSGQIPLDPATGELVGGEIEVQIGRVFENLTGIIEAAGAGFDQVVKLNVYLTDLKHFALVNQIMAQYFREPYPARAAVGVASLPRGAQVEMDCVLYLG